MRGPHNDRLSSTGLIPLGLLEERPPLSLKVGTLSLVLGQPTLQCGPLCVTLFTPEDRGAVVHVRRILMAARRLEVAVGRVLHAREFPTSGDPKTDDLRAAVQGERTSGDPPAAESAADPVVTSRAVTPLHARRPVQVGLQATGGSTNTGGRG